MIKVVKKDNDNNQKVVGNFLKRVKKANQVNRIRKSRFEEKKPSHLKKKRKAIRIAKYSEDQKYKELVGKL